MFKSRTLTLCIAHFSEYCDSYTDMLVNSSLLRCHDTYRSNELYRASEFLFYHYVKRFLDFLLSFCFLQPWQKSTRCRACKAVFRPYYTVITYILLKKKSRACTCHTLQTGLYNQLKPMQPNILLLVAFAEVNARCSCSLVEDIKNKQ